MPRIATQAHSSTLTYSYITLDATNLSLVDSPSQKKMREPRRGSRLPPVDCSNIKSMPVSIRDWLFHRVIPQPSEVPPPTVDSNGRRRSHGKKKPSGHQPRPRNAFILFRWDFVMQKVIGAEYENDHRVISRIGGEVWNAMSDAQRLPWKKLAHQEKMLHKTTYPDYQYSNGGSSSGKARSRRPRKPQQSSISLETDAGDHLNDDNLSPEQVWTPRGASPTDASSSLSVPPSPSSTEASATSWGDTQTYIGTHGSSQSSVYDPLHCLSTASAHAESPIFPTSSYDFNLEAPTVATPLFSSSLSSLPTESLQAGGTTAELVDCEPTYEWSLPRDLGYAPTYLPPGFCDHVSPIAHGEYLIPFAGPEYNTAYGYTAIEDPPLETFMQASFDGYSWPLG